MGLFDFVKKAGKSLFGSEAEAAEAAPPADAVKKEIESHGLEAEDLDVKVEGDAVEIRARAATQELREKIIVAAGNIAGVAQVREEIAVAQEAPESVFHTVEKGDTLWAIASKHYGNGAKYTHIFEANRPMLEDPDKIYPGQALRIPPI